MNEVILMGRLTRDPYYGEGEGEHGAYKRASFYLAVNRSFSKESAFVKVTAFDKTAELVRDYLCQGKQILIVGELATGSYTDRQTGKKIYTMEVNARRIEFTGKKEGGTRDSPQSSQGNGDFMDIPDDMAEELPFR